MAAVKKQHVIHREARIAVSMGNSTFKRMKALGAKVEFTEMANHGHNVNEAAFTCTGDTKANGGVTKAGNTVTARKHGACGPLHPILGAE